MTTTKPFALGSVSTGTLRTEDLLPRFVAALEALSWSAAIERDGYDDLLQVHIDELNALCPPFVYFGAHPGDGADFGFWPDHDALEECNHDGEGEHICHRNSVIINVDDHGNVTVMDLDRNILWSTV